jgi:hypothetical protein
MAVAMGGGFARHFPRPVHGCGLVVTLWRKGAKWDKVEDIFYSVEYCYEALFGGDHIKSPF